MTEAVTISHKTNHEKDINGQIYQQRIVFIECVQVARVGDRNCDDETTFVSLLKSNSYQQPQEYGATINASEVKFCDERNR